LLVSLQSEEARRRAAAVVDGVAYGLELPGSAARLVSRDARGTPESIAEALVSLSAEGASVVIAGVADEDAEEAARFAEANQMPVILLRPPAHAPGGTFSFVLGPEPAAVEEALAGALVQKGAAQVAILADAPERHTRPIPSVVAVRGCAEGAAAWKSLGATGVVLDAGCARDVMATAPPKVRWAMGFEAGSPSLPKGSLVATMGLFPINPLALPEALSPWMKSHAMPPDLWAALGRDAAKLAWAAVMALPAQGTQEPQEVVAQRTKAAGALAEATLDLWTTEAHGFGGARVMPRSLGILEK